ncbi:MAG: hypothetical protein PVI26_13050 [Chitinispirillia bacterium]|jgi:hypothetical protein
MYLFNYIISILLFIILAGCRTYEHRLLGEAERSAELAQWRYLDDLLVDIPLPSLYSPTANRFQSHCLSNTGDIDTLDPDLHVHEKYLDLKLIANKIKKDLSLLIREPDSTINKKKRPGSSRLDFIMQWHVFLFGLKYLRVHKESLDLTFQNDRCIFEDLSWYKDGREIVTSAMFIDSILFILDEKYLKGDDFYLDSSFTSGPLQNENGLSFSLYKSSKGYYKIVSRSIFYAVKTVSLEAHEFTYSYDSVQAWIHYPFVTNSFMVRKKDSNESFCYFWIYTPEKRSPLYCAIVGKPRVFTIESDYIGTFTPVYKDYGYHVDITCAKIRDMVNPEKYSSDTIKTQKK